jgi:hypothetical protein
MKVRALAFSRLVSVLVIALTPMSAFGAQVKPLSGAFGFLLNASFDNPSNQGGLAILGLMNFDGAGSVSGPYSLELGSGGAGNVTLSITFVSSGPGVFTGTFVGTN